MKIEIEKTSPDVPTPKYATAGSAGFDITNQGETVSLAPGQVMVIPTGLKIKIPEGTVALLTPRSGKSITGYSVNNAPGIIDEDFRNEMKVIAVNNGNNAVSIEHGERIAQIVVVPYMKGVLEIVDQLSPDDYNERGLGGLGHSGTY